MTMTSSQDLVVLMERIPQLETVVMAQQQALAQQQAQAQGTSEVLQSTLLQAVQAVQQQTATDFQAQMGQVVSSFQAQSQAQQENLRHMMAMVQNLAAAPATSPSASAGGSAPTSHPQASSRSSHSLIDTRVLGKPNVFSGDTADPKNPWMQWSFVAKAYFAAVDMRLAALLTAASDRSEDTAPIDNATLITEEAQLSTTVYYALCMLTRDEALTIVRSVPEGHGFEAWRKLDHQFAPKVASRFQNMMEGILYPVVSGTQYQRAWQDWEELVRAYELQSGEVISDMIKIATLTYRLVDEKLRDHLLLNAKPNLKYQQVREHVEAVYIARRRDWTTKSSTDMDLDALYKGKGKDKGKKGSSKGKKGTYKGNLKGDKSSAKDKETCFYCGKQGHMAKECRKKTKDEKGKAGGKGETSYKTEAAGDAAALTAEEDQSAFIFALSSEEDEMQELMVDSGASRSVCTPSFVGDRVLTQGPAVVLRDASGNSVPFHGRTRIKMIANGAYDMEKDFEVRDVHRNILSVSELVDAGCTVVFSKKEAYVERRGYRMDLRRKLGVFALPVEVICPLVGATIHGGASRRDHSASSERTHRRGEGTTYQTYAEEAQPHGNHATHGGTRSFSNMVQTLRGRPRPRPRTQTNQHRVRVPYRLDGLCFLRPRGRADACDDVGDARAAERRRRRDSGCRERRVRLCSRRGVALLELVGPRQDHHSHRRRASDRQLS